MIKTVLAAALVLSSLAVAAPALAAEARASGDVPVREGPGNRFAVIDQLTSGAYYDVLDCTRASHWCLVADGGYELGWVRGSYLVGSGAKARVTPFEFLVRPDFTPNN